MKKRDNIKWLVFMLLFFPVFLVKGQDLQTYLQLAGENNPGLQAAYAQYEAALQKAPQVKSLDDPTLSMSAFGEMEDARISLAQPFEWFGTKSARADAADLLAEARFQAYLDQRNQLYFEVSEQYFRLYELEQQLRFQKENLEILNDFKELALARVRSGEGALADVLQVDLLRNETETSLTLLELERRPLKAAFNALLNREKDAPVSLPEKLKPVRSAEPGLEEHFEAHPRLMEMERRREAAASDQEAARKSGMPSFGVGVDVMIGQRMAMDSPEHRVDVVMPMLSVRLPIFRKKYNAAEEEARLMQESYNRQREEVENSLQADYEAAVFEAQKTQELLGLYDKQVERSRQVLDLLLSAYKNAETAFEEVLRVRQDLLKYQLQRSEAEVSYLIQMARINYLTGNSYRNDQAE